MYFVFYCSFLSRSYDRILSLKSRNLWLYFGVNSALLPKTDFISSLSYPSRLSFALYSFKERLRKELRLLLNISLVAVKFSIVILKDSFFLFLSEKFSLYPKFYIDLFSVLSLFCLLTWGKDTTKLVTLGNSMVLPYIKVTYSIFFLLNKAWKLVGSIFFFYSLLLALICIIKSLYQ